MEISNKQLKAKVRNLQQQFTWCKTKLSNMSDIINNLQDNLVNKTEIADRLHESFDKLQLSIFHNAKNNTMTLYPVADNTQMISKNFPSHYITIPRKPMNMYDQLYLYQIHH